MKSPLHIHLEEPCESNSWMHSSGNCDIKETGSLTLGSQIVYCSLQILFCSHHTIVIVSMYCFIDSVIKLE